jgi:hypothetical protein
MRPKNTKENRWVIWHESWHETKKDAMKSAKLSHAPYDVDYVPHAKTMFGNYRKNQWRLRTYIPVMYKGKKVQTGGMSHSRAMEVAKYHKDKKLVKIRNHYYYI